MDDPDLYWPAWKFGLKRQDLYTTLHSQYNTFSLDIQDPEAFHHDVFEISRDADTTEEFHRLMADRRRQRLHELHESLESLAVEIIANPKLMDSDHWQYALQLFRTKSFDSIVRYFASYLPEDYLESQSTSSSFSEAHSTHTASTKASSVDDAPCPSIYDSDYDTLADGPIMTEEPELMLEQVLEHRHCTSHYVGPPSPPESDAASSISSRADAESTRSDMPTNPPSRSMSFSGSESGVFGPDMIRRSFILEDEAMSTSDDGTAVTLLTDSAESDAASHYHDQPPTPTDTDQDEDDYPPTQFPEDVLDVFDNLNDFLDSDTPTPRPETVTGCYVNHKTVVRHTLPSPHRRSPSPRLRTDGVTPSTTLTKRSPEEALSKIQKPLAVSLRRQPRGKRRLGC